MTTTQHHLVVQPTPPPDAALRARLGEPKATETECPLVTQVRRVEPPMLTELVAAMFHLERLADTVGTPQEEAAAHTNPGITPEQHCSFVLGNADRIRRALDAITAPYETATATAPSTG